MKLNEMNFSDEQINMIRTAIRGPNMKTLLLLATLTLIEAGSPTAPVCIEYCTEGQTTSTTTKGN